MGYSFFFFLPFSEGRLLPRGELGEPARSGSHVLGGPTAIVLRPPSTADLPPEGFRPFYPMPYQGANGASRPDPGTRPRNDRLLSYQCLDRDVAKLFSFFFVSPCGFSSEGHSHREG